MTMRGIIGCLLCVVVFIARPACAQQSDGFAHMIIEQEVFDEYVQPGEEPIVIESFYLEVGSPQVKGSGEQVAYTILADSFLQLAYADHYRRLPGGDWQYTSLHLPNTYDLDDMDLLDSVHGWGAFIYQTEVSANQLPSRIYSLPVKIRQRIGDFYYYNKQEDAAFVIYPKGLGYPTNAVIIAEALNRQLNMPFAGVE